MKLIESKVELLEQEDFFKQIELAGRTCYKSEDKITEASAVDFVKKMVKNGHTAMLEHGTIYLQIRRWLNPGDTSELSKYEYNPYSKYNELFFGNNSKGFYVTTNYRVLQENGWLDDLKYLCEPTEFHKRRITLKFTTDRGVSHELVRHKLCVA